MNSRITPEKIVSMRSNLTAVRQASLRATRAGDFMRVAYLGAQAAQINKSISDAECQMLTEL
jgi:hypothetical protein